MGQGPDRVGSVSRGKKQSTMEEKTWEFKKEGKFELTYNFEFPKIICFPQIFKLKKDYLFLNSLENAQKVNEIWLNEKYNCN